MFDHCLIGQAPARHPQAWAGKSSDISYYLNSHHVDFHEWCLRGRARPEAVTALASDGVASERVGRPCEDTITLAVRWRNKLEPPALQEENQGREGRQEGAATRRARSWVQAFACGSWRPGGQGKNTPQRTQQITEQITIK